MSSDLHVHLIMPMSLSQLLAASQDALTRLLGVQEAPRLWIQELTEGALHTSTTDRIDRSDQSYMLGLENTGHAVMLVTWALSEMSPYIPNESAGLWAGVSVGRMRSPLEYALAASIAVALAFIGNTEVEDPGLIWAERIQNSPDDFMNQIAVRESVPDLQSAADMLFNNLAMERRARQK